MRSVGPRLAGAVGIMRKRTRLADFDGSINGAYFLTVCTHRRRWLLQGEVLQIAEHEWRALPARFPGLTLDCWTFQPDHLHALVQLSECQSTLSASIQAYKSITTRLIKSQGGLDRVWQRSFYDRIVRDERDLQSLREYVQHNDIVHQTLGNGR